MQPVICRFAAILVAGCLCQPAVAQKKLDLKIRQITFGPHHHFFGYIGQSLTVPWNASGRYILTLRTTFHDRMPNPGETADICLIDTQDGNEVIPIEKSRAWNFQQGTMFYWHPRKAETQFFFNDRDPKTHQIFTVLYDIEKQERVREYRFDDASIGNGGVSPTGEFFLAINYGRMARLRPVTGYPGAADPTEKTPAPENDGIFRVDIDTGEHTLLVSFRQLRDLLHDRHEHIEDVGFYINHSLSNRTGEFVYFYARGDYQGKSMAVNVPCSIRTDGTELAAHPFIGGHPEWDLGTVVFGAEDGKQVRYDIRQKKIIGQLATEEILPGPDGDIALSPNGDLFADGYSLNDRKNIKYSVYRRSDGAWAHSRLFERGGRLMQKGELRIDPAPRWNRSQTALLVPEMTKDGTRQLHIMEIAE